MNYTLPGSSALGILQARILEWVACLPPGDLPDSGIEPTSLMPPASGRQVLYNQSYLGSPPQKGGEMKELSFNEYTDSALQDEKSSGNGWW